MADEEVIRFARVNTIESKRYIELPDCYPEVDIVKLEYYISTKEGGFREAYGLEIYTVTEEDKDRMRNYVKQLDELDLGVSLSLPLTFPEKFTPARKVFKQIKDRDKED